MERVHRQIEPFLDFEGRQRSDDGEQLRLDREPVHHRLPARHRQALPGQPDAGPRRGESRLEAGISYTEFSYVLLQSMDFLDLYRAHRVRLQFGGSDQWGNLTVGVGPHPSRRRRHGARLRTPAVTKADDTKYGKTEGGALWLDPAMMSPTVPPVLAQRRGRQGGRAAEASRSSPGRDRGARGRDRREALPPGAGEGLARRRGRRRSTGRRRPSTPRPRPRRCSAGETCASCVARPCCGAPEAAFDAGLTRASVSSTCWWRPASSEQGREARRTISRRSHLNNSRMPQERRTPRPGDDEPARRAGWSFAGRRTSRCRGCR